MLKMGFWDIVKECLRENLLLFKGDFEKFRQVNAVRVVSIVVVAITLTVVILLLNGQVALDTSVLASVFAIFISWLFFSMARRDSDHARSLIRELRDEQVKYREEVVRSGILRTDQDMVADVEEAVKRASDEPIIGDIPPDRTFPILNAMMNDPAKRCVISMHKDNVPFYRSGTFYLESVSEDGVRRYLPIDKHAMAQELSSLGLAYLQPDLRPVPHARVRNELLLTKRGHSFAQWLIDSGQDIGSVKTIRVEPVVDHQT